MGRSGAAPVLRLRCGAVAFFVFVAGAAGAWIVAAYFGAGSDWLGRFRLRGAGLILQIFLLALLFALELAGYFRETLRLAFAGTRGGAGYGGLRSTRAASPERRLLRVRARFHLLPVAV